MDGVARREVVAFVSDHVADRPFEHVAHLLARVASSARRPTARRGEDAQARLEHAGLEIAVQVLQRERHFGQVDPRRWPAADDRQGCGWRVAVDEKAEVRLQRGARLIACTRLGFKRPFSILEIVEAGTPGRRQLA
jgi:hypothetical protein